jgi:YidC/Oxa1 family membrane protein insertase
MERWTMWTSLIELALRYMGSQFGLSEALAIIVLTLIVRGALLPVSLASAWRMQKNKEAMARLRPELDALRAKLADRPSELAARTMALYRERGISFIDRLSLVNIASQAVFGLGFIQSLRRTIFHSKFLWIASLGKPDILLTALVALLMTLTMALAPGATGETSMLLIIAISVAVSVFAIASLPSAIGLYWATSNGVAVAQTLALRRLVSRRAHRTHATRAGSAD